MCGVDPGFVGWSAVCDCRIHGQIHLLFCVLCCMCSKLISLCMCFFVFFFGGGGGLKICVFVVIYDYLVSSLYCRVSFFFIRFGS